MDTISQKIDTTLTLTIAYKAADALEARYDQWTLFRYVGIFSLGMSALGARMAGQAGVAAMATRTTHRVVMVVLARMVMESIVSPDVRPAGSLISSRVQSEASHAMQGAWSGISWAASGWIPMNVWPAANKLMMLLCVVVAFTSGLNLLRQGSDAAIKKAGRTGQGQGVGWDDIDKIVSNVQFAFADSVTGLVDDNRTRALLAGAGLLFLPELERIIRRNVNKGKDSRSQTAAAVLGGISMGWVGIVVQAATLGGIGGGVGKVINIVTSLSIALIMQSVGDLLPGASILQGYIEFNIANSVSDMLSLGRGGLMLFEIGLIGVVFSTGVSQLMDFLESSMYNGKREGLVSVKNTVQHIWTLVTVNSLAKYVTGSVLRQSPFDAVVVIVGAMVWARAFNRVWVKWTQGAHGLYSV